MPMVVGPPSWQDQLRDEMHELETRARLDDPLALGQARNMLRTFGVSRSGSGRSRSNPIPSTHTSGSLCRSVPHSAAARTGESESRS